MANRPPRFPDFPYIGFCRYFLTICVDQRAQVFLDIDFGKFVASQLLQIGAGMQFEVIARWTPPWK